MQASTAASPYVCITSDTHAGTAIDTYGEYLEPRYRADLEAWRAAYRNPSKKHIGGWLVTPAVEGDPPLSSAVGDRSGARVG